MAMVSLSGHFVLTPSSILHPDRAPPSPGPGYLVPPCLTSTPSTVCWSPACRASDNKCLCLSPPGSVLPSSSCTSTGVTGSVVCWGSPSLALTHTLGLRGQCEDMASCGHLRARACSHIHPQRLAVRADAAPMLPTPGAGSPGSSEQLTRVHPQGTMSQQRPAHRWFLTALAH